MRLNTRLRRLAAKVPPPECPQCHGYQRPVFAEVAVGEPAPPPPPCPGCGRRAMLIEVVVRETGQPPEGADR